MVNTQEYDSLKKEERRLFAEISVLYTEYSKGNEIVFNQLESLRSHYDIIFEKMTESKKALIKKLLPY